jgi:inosine-uridine nucleoside N-ribohydrolase
MRVHLDTDIGGDTDDACALAMLLGVPDVDLLGVTTTSDASGAGAARAARPAGTRRRARGGRVPPCR